MSVDMSDDPRVASDEKNCVAIVSQAGSSVVVGNEEREEWIMMNFEHAPFDLEETI